MIFLFDRTNNFYLNTYFFYLKVNILPIDQMCSIEPKTVIIVFPLPQVIFVLASWTSRLRKKKVKSSDGCKNILGMGFGKRCQCCKDKAWARSPQSYLRVQSANLCNHSCGQLDSTLDVINLTICVLTYLLKGVIYQGKSVSIPSFLRDKTSFFSNWLAYRKDKFDKTGS